MTTARRFVSLLILLAIASVGVWLLRGANHGWQDTGSARVTRTSGAMQSLQWFATQRCYPRQALPRRGYAEAFDYSRRFLRKSLAADAENTPWQALGPQNVGGRTLALAFNPQNPLTIYAGAASGGLWRSYTAGVGVQAWHYVSTGFPVLGVAAIAIAPDDSSEIYIGTGEVYAHANTQGGIAVRLTRGSFGLGILKSEDGGATWFKSLDWSYDQGRAVQVIRLDPTNPDIVWAGTTEGVYKSLDAGARWTRVHDVVMVTDLVIHSGNPNLVIAACGNLSSPGHGLYRTIDGGLSWSRIVQPGVIPETFNGKGQLAICAANPDVVMASIGNGTEVPDGPDNDNATWLLRTEDAGASWSLMSEGDYSRWQGWFSHDVAIHPENPDLVIAAGIDIVRSLEGGANLDWRSSWRRGYGGQILPGEPEGPGNYSHADHHDIVFHPHHPDTIYFANDGGIFRSLDGGETFESCNGGYQTTQFYPGFTSSQQDSFLALGGLQDNGTVIFDGTDAWIRATGGDGGWTAVDPTSDDVIYSSAQFLVLFRSEDHGETFEDITPPEIPGLAGFIAPFVLSNAIEPDVIYAASSTLLKSTDRGENWTIENFGLDFDGNPALALAVAPSRREVLAVTTAPVTTRAGVFRSTNSGRRFIDITGDLPDRYPVGLAFDPLDSRTLYVTFSGFGTSHVFRTVDAGGTWQDIGQELPDIPTNAVIVDPEFSDHVYVGTDLGVYVTTDGGITWSEFHDGLPEAAVCMDLSIHESSRMLRVSTYGNGVYERPLLPEDGGGNGEIPDADLIALAQNVPNPFNAGTDIEYNLERDGHVKLTVWNLRGQKVATLLDGLEEAGRRPVHWEGFGDDGRRLPSGLYVYRLEALGRELTRKMQIVR